jgi:hypothetical protein
MCLPAASAIEPVVLSLPCSVGLPFGCKVTPFYINGIMLSVKSTSEEVINKPE